MRPKRPVGAAGCPETQETGAKPPHARRTRKPGRAGSRSPGQRWCLHGSCTRGRRHGHGAGAGRDSKPDTRDATLGRRSGDRYEQPVGRLAATVIVDRP
jgi:hypothetical protein